MYIDVLDCWALSASNAETNISREPSALRSAYAPS